MNHQEPPAEVRQVSLFTHPLSKVYELQDALKEDERLVKEYEQDYPVELEELLEAAKELSAQIKEQKEEFLAELNRTGTEYLRARKQAAETKIALDNAVMTFKQLATEETDQNGHIEQTIEVNGQIVRLQTQKTAKVEIFLNGKEL